MNPTQISLSVFLSFFGGTSVGAPTRDPSNEPLSAGTLYLLLREKDESLSPTWRLNSPMRWGQPASPTWAPGPHGDPISGIQS